VSSSHWDALLGEMQAVAKDVSELRKFKKARCKSIQPPRFRPPTKAATAVQAFWDSVCCQPMAQPLMKSPPTVSPGTLFSAAPGDSIQITPLFKTVLNSADRALLRKVVAAGAQTTSVLLNPDSKSIVLALMASLAAEKSTWGPHLILCSDDIAPMWRAAFKLFLPVFRLYSPRQGAPPPGQMDVFIGTSDEVLNSVPKWDVVVVASVPNVALPAAAPSWPILFLNSTVHHPSETLNLVFTVASKVCCCSPSFVLRV